MDTPALPDPVEDLPTAPPSPRGSRRSALVGALVGMTALAGTIIGVGAIASAQDDPEPSTEATPAAESEAEGDVGELDAEFAAYDECMSEQLGDLWLEPEILVEGEFDEGMFEEGMFEEGVFEEGELEEGVFEFPEFELPEFDEEKFVAAEEACADLLPEEIKAEIEAWRPYEECIDAAIGDLADPWESGEEPSDEEWDAFDAAWDAADESCRDLLPEDVRAEMAAWDDFDQCLTEAGVFDEAFGVSVVHIETGDGFQVAEFGDTEGTVTVTGTDGNLSVATSGGVTLLDEDALDSQWEAFDEAHAACEELLPEELRGFGDIVEFDMDGDIADDIDGDEDADTES